MPTEEGIILPEIKELRTLNQKHFDNGDGSFTMDAYGGQIHYFNKLGIGDGEIRFREIDWTLQWDEVKRGWFFQFHSFQPFLPEFSDEWVEFRDLFDDKDQTIRYKAQCTHVKGRLVKPEEIGIERLTHVNCVIYDDAFGEGKDYILYFSYNSLVKVVRIREKYKQAQDEAFNFEVEFPKDYNGKYLDVYRGDNKEQISYTLDLTRDKIFDTAKNTLIGVQGEDNQKEYYTYLKSFKTWDSGVEENYHSQIITAKLSLDGEGKRILTKFITADFIQKSVGDVYTDTTTTFNDTTGSGRVQYDNASTFAGAHNATDGTSAATDYAFSRTRQESTNNFDIYRAFFPFDTSGIDDVATITGALFKPTSGGSVTNGYDDAYGYMAVVQNTQASPTALTTADYDACGSTEGSQQMDINDIATTTQVTFTLNATGLTWINKTGYTMLCIREGHDIQNQTVAVNGNGNSSSWYTLGTADAAKYPVLSVTYTPSSSSSIKTVDGLAVASVKTVNGLALASVKTVNGLA